MLAIAHFEGGLLSYQFTNGYALWNDLKSMVAVDYSKGYEMVLKELYINDA